MLLGYTIDPESRDWDASPAKDKRDNIWPCLPLIPAPSAQGVQLQIQRAIPGEQRLIIALEMSLFARELAKQRIRQEHPDWAESQVSRELLRLAFLPAPLPAPLR
jgi:hypothetical protein